MKKIILGLSVIAAVSFASCKKSDDAVAAGVSVSAVSSTVMTGNWRVTYFYDNNNDETANFSGYAFSFADSNILAAVKGATSVSGTWTTGTDDSKTKLILAFSSPAQFGEISGDWEVLERTDIKLRLQDASGGGGQTDFLTFEKN